MLRIALERGLSSVIARWMLEGPADGVLDRVARSGALPPEELEALRAQTKARLQRVRDDGAPYAEMVSEALGGVRAALPDLGTLFRSTDPATARVLAAAVADELARRASRAARTAAGRWQAEAGDSAPADAPADASADARADNAAVNTDSAAVDAEPEVEAP